jgi:hypothetical protein
MTGALTSPLCLVRRAVWSDLVRRGALLAADAARVGAGYCHDPQVT